VLPASDQVLTNAFNVKLDLPSIRIYDNVYVPMDIIWTHNHRLASPATRLVRNAQGELLINAFLALNLHLSYRIRSASANRGSSMKLPLIPACLVGFTVLHARMQLRVTRVMIAMQFSHLQVYANVKPLWLECLEIIYAKHAFLHVLHAMEHSKINVSHALAQRTFN